MSGYLQRLAASARRRDGAIHPMVGSIYSPPKSHSRPLLLEEETPAEFVTDNRATETAVGSPVKSDRTAEQPTPGDHVYGGAVEQQVSLLPPNLKEAETIRDPEPGKSNAAVERETLLMRLDGSRVADAASPEPRREKSIPTERQAIPRRMTPPPEREPNEIEINIGRIEVTAVPPLAVRPAAPPRRKSLNLDEYLKRGRGRAR